MADCFFAAYDSTECSGPPSDPAHLIPKQRIRLTGGTEEEQMDPRIIVPACRSHHYRADYFHVLPLPLSAYPESVLEYAAEYGWSYDDRQGWLKLA